MCGRFARSVSIDVIIEENEIKQNLYDGIKSSYNIAPGSEIAAIILDHEKKLVSFKWGYIPSWSRKPVPVINARAESILQKPYFKISFRERRCLIIADGFYEWRKDGKRKIPVYIRMKDGSPFTMAGVYDFWKSESGKLIGTCSIITTESNELIRQIHDRMPAIIREKDRGLWLDCSTPELPLPFMGAYSPDSMEMYDVSGAVNSVKNDGPECIEPLKKDKY